MKKELRNKVKTYAKKRAKIIEVYDKAVNKKNEDLAELDNSITSHCLNKIGDIVQMKYNSDRFHKLKVTHRLMVIRKISFKPNFYHEDSKKDCFIFDGVEVDKDGKPYLYRVDAMGWSSV